MLADDDPWVKTGSESYDNCIVGNRDGLLLLKDSIDEAISQRSASPGYFADFTSIVCTDDEWDSSEESSLPKWQQLLFKICALVWFALLPLLGIGFVISWFL